MCKKITQGGFNRDLYCNCACKLMVLWVKEETVHNHTNDQTSDALPKNRILFSSVSSQSFFLKLLKTLLISFVLVPRSTDSMNVSAAILLTHFLRLHKPNQRLVASHPVLLPQHCTLTLAHTPMNNFIQLFFIVTLQLHLSCCFLQESLFCDTVEEKSDISW